MKRNRGLTLIEMLVAMAITLVMMAAVMTLFGTVGNSISESRSTMEMSERLRNARNVLQNDLGRMTVTFQPPRRPENDEGYFEYSEGPASDYWPGTFFTSAQYWPNGPNNPPTASDVPFAAPSASKSIAGDTDDIIAFTARSRGEPFVGIVGGVTVQSWYAEIIYFLAAAPGAQSLIDQDTGVQLQPRTLYRRVILINPSAVIGPTAGRTVAQYQADNDLAVRIRGTDFAACTIGDLTKREHRFAHDPSAYPFAITGLSAYSGSRLGEDVLLTNVVAFDVKAYDPSVPVRMVNGVAVMPSDPGYSMAGSPIISNGGYVDLGYNRYLPTAMAGASRFSGPGLYPALLPRVYDTWSMHYEANGIDENGDGTFDLGTNALDDPITGVSGVYIDDDPEWESPPPYGIFHWSGINTIDIRGIQIKIRVYEPDSRQVREVTVVQDFMPQ